MVSPTATLEIAPGDADQRLDRWFRRHYPEIGHGRLEKLLRTGQIRVNGKRVRAGTRLAPGDRVRVPPLPDPGKDREDHARRRPAAPPDDADAGMVREAVIYRDDDVIALNKPPGLAVQGGSRVSSHLDGMLDALRFEAAEAPRLVHRLDRDTSGVILLARHAAAARELTALFRTRGLQKLYWALVVGVPKPAQGRIDAPLAKRQAGAGERMVAAAEGGLRAVTDYALIEAAGRSLSWLALMPRTGRTHQLRAHTVSVLGFPIVGDGKYGGEAAFPPGFEPRLHLHARALELPRGRKAPLVLTAPLPPHMAASWRFLGFDPEPGGDEFALFEDAP